jgi:hypothetical protein
MNMSLQCSPCAGQAHGAGGFDTAIELARAAVAGPASLAATLVRPPPAPAPTPPRLARYCDLLINAIVIVFAIIIGVLVANDAGAIPAFPTGELDGDMDGVFAVFDLADAAVDGELVADYTDLYSFVVATLVCCLLCVFTCGWRATPTSAPTKPTSAPTTPTSDPTTAVPSARSHTRELSEFRRYVWGLIADKEDAELAALPPHERAAQRELHREARMRANHGRNLDSVRACHDDGASRTYVPAYSDFAEPDFADPVLEAASHHFVSVNRPPAGVVHRRAGAPPLFLLTLFTCIAPVESAVVHLLASDGPLGAEGHEYRQHEQKR